MTPAATSSPLAEVTTVELSRAELDADGPSPQREGVDSVRSLVGAATSTARLVLIEPGDIRRLDLWRTDTALVLHPFAADPERATPCRVVTGVAPWSVVALMFPEPDQAAGPVPPVEGGALRFDDVGHLADAVAEGETVPGLIGAVALRSTRDGDPDSAQVLAMVALGPSIWWGRSAPGEELALTEGRPAQFWSAVLEALHL